MHTFIKLMTEFYGAARLCVSAVLIVVVTFGRSLNGCLKSAATFWSSAVQKCFETSEVIGINGIHQPTLHAHKLLCHHTPLTYCL